MRTNNHSLFVFVLTILLTLQGCSTSSTVNELENDHYYSETDMQYFYKGDTISTAKIQETATGCFLYHKGFIYQYDNESQMILPLCSKPNCLHDREKDPEKLENCNAYLDNKLDGGEVSVMYYKGDVYVSYQEIYSKGFKYPSAVMRIKGDGSSKEVIFEHDSMTSVMQHRGFIYFLNYGFTVDDQGIEGESGIMRVDITKNEPKAESIYVAKKPVLGSGYLLGYGNHVYFYYYYNEEGFSHHLFDYKINSGNVTESPFVCKMPIPFNGRLYGADYAVTDPSDKTNGTIYSANLEGKDQKVAIKMKSQEYGQQSDPKYFYFSDEWDYYEGKNNSKHIWIYDAEMNLIDETVQPNADKAPLTTPVGGEKLQYIRFDDEETGEWGLYIWDKSEIGTLHGKEYTQKKVLYENRK